mgnify:CR=1 FL=1
MKKIFLFFTALASTFIFCSCTTVTEDLGDAYANMDIKFHNKDYMEDQELRVPHGVNEKRFEKLPFLIGFSQLNRSENGEKTSDTITPKEFSILKKEFEQVIVATKRFPVAQIVEGRADGDLRKAIRNGIANASELDASEMEKAEYIINVAAYLGQNSVQSGSQRKTTFTMTLVCNPVFAKNNKPLDWFPSFTITSKKDIFQKATATGRVRGGMRLYTADQREELRKELFRMALVKFIDHIYNAFPAGGKVVSIEDDMIAIKANRATGLQPNMEMVVYARAKGNPDAMRVPLYNASIATMAQEGNSELQIWRKSDKKSAKKIMEKINKDFAEAAEEYDFFGASSGLPNAPDFIKTSKDKE